MATGNSSTTIFYLSMNDIRELLSAVRLPRPNSPFFPWVLANFPWFGRPSVLLVWLIHSTFHRLDLVRSSTIQTHGSARKISGAVNKCSITEEIYQELSTLGFFLFASIQSSSTDTFPMTGSPSSTFSTTKTPNPPTTQRVEISIFKSQFANVGTDYVHRTPIIDPERANHAQRVAHELGHGDCTGGSC